MLRRVNFAARFSSKAALAVTLCWVAFLAATGATDALLFLAPALLIAVPLLGGYYAGEELIARLASRRCPRAARPARRATGRVRPPAPTWPARGARLLAFSLAKRPPPTAPLPQV